MTAQCNLSWVNIHNSGVVQTHPKPRLSDLSKCFVSNQLSSPGLPVTVMLSPKPYLVHAI